MTNYKIDYEETNRYILPDLERWLSEWYPNGRRIGNEYVFGSWAGEKGESLSINLSTGKGGDFACGDLVGDVIGIYQKRFDITRYESAKAIRGLYGLIDGDDSHTNNKEKQLPSLPPLIENKNVEIEKENKLNRIIKEIKEIQENDPAFLYLKSRGIEKFDKNIFKARKEKNGCGTLVCIAKDENGKIKAIQQIFLTKEGKKNITDKKKNCKYTNGFPSGNPIKIPVNYDILKNITKDSLLEYPILVCEGPEDGITLSNAVGFEVWVSCGLNFMDKIPLITGRQCIICRDNDPAGSDADKTINKVFDKLLNRGFNLLCARAPEGIKDANDLLRLKGNDAIIEMINNAIVVKKKVEIFPEQPKQELKSQKKDDSIFKACSFFQHTDVGNSNRIKERFGNMAKFVKEIGWIFYRHGKWSTDTGESDAMRMAQQMVCDISKEKDFVEDDYKMPIVKWCKQSQSYNHVVGALKLSASKLTVSSDIFDTNPLFLNCKNGIVDLKSGKKLEHDFKHFITKQIDIDYDPKAKCPVWERFLKDVFLEDISMIDFVQKAIGYSFTGKTTEQCIFILFGNGSNGKSTFLDILQFIAGDYFARTKAEALMQKDKNSGDANPYIASLFGSRFVTASEVGVQGILNESLIKEMTGDDKIAVRFLHKNPFTFTPQFKLWLATNYKPDIRGNDDGIWRRIKIIPFNAKFYDENDADAPANCVRKDKMLLLKLKAESKGILNWIIKGAIKWAEVGGTGLFIPEKIQQATLDYRKEMDILGNFAEDCCDISLERNCSCDDLYKVYRRWCLESGHYAITKNKFGRKMHDKGFGSCYVGSSKGYTGIDITDTKRSYYELYRNDCDNNYVKEPQQNFQKRNYNDEDVPF